MSPQEINYQVQQEMDNFLRKPFLGLLPLWFMDNFPNAVMELPQTDVPYRGEAIQSILGKTNDELSFFEVGLIVNILLSVQPKIIEAKIEKYIAKKISLEGIRTQWNLMNNTEKERLKRKAASLQQHNHTIKN